MRTVLAVILAMLVSASLSAAPALTGITPSQAFTFGPTIVQIAGTELSPTAVRCGDSNLCPIRIWFGQMEGRVIAASFGQIAAEAPGQQEGRIVDVRVRLADGTELTLPQALEYSLNPWDAGRANYVRYLVPITSVNLPGAHGSIWTSELFVHNSSAALAYLPLDCHPIHPTFGLWSPCGDLQPNSVQRFRAWTSGREGAFIHVPRPLTGGVHFQLRARDLSRENEGWGTEVPVVPLEAFRPNEDGFLGDSVRLLNVPVDARYRATLRIYGGDASPIDVRIEVRAQSDARLIETRIVTLLPGVGGELPLTPAYLQLDPLTDLVRASGQDRVLVTVAFEMPPLVDPPFTRPIWALLSITNNVTQEVTVITPHRP